jgi:hypothetical protein
MPIESGPYCQYCVDANGKLKSFAETFERFRQWTLRENPKLGQEQATQNVLGFMAEIPAWKDHPEVLKRTGQNGR